MIRDLADSHAPRVGPFRWIRRGGRKRALIIYPLVLTTRIYLGFGVWLAATKSYWRASDTFSMVAGCIFFVIGTSLAVAHETSQEKQEEILHNQGVILDEVKDLANKTYQYLSTDTQGLPGDMREVRTPHDTAPAVTTPQTESALGFLSSPDVNELADLKDPSPIELVQENLRLYEDPDEKREALQRFALESAIEARAGTTALRELLKQTKLFALGSTAGDISVPGRGTESDILHFTIDERDGKERVLMPLFTRFDVIQDTMVRNPDWKDLGILEVNGGDLIANRDRDVTLVINPWSRLEWQLYPPADNVSTQDGSTTT